MRPSLPAAAACLALAAGCAHAGAPPGPPPTWPRPPAAPRVAFAGPVPGDDRPDGRSAFRRVLDAIAGVDRSREAPLLVRPFGLAVAAGALYVADPDGPSVIRFELASGEATPIRCETPWGAPMAIAAAPWGDLLVADAGAAAIVAVSPGGSCSSLGRGALVRPTGVAVAGGEIFVADPPAQQVVVLDRAGGELRRWGGRGAGDDGFNFPVALAAAPDGTIVVVDSLNFQVKRFRADGAFLVGFGGPGDYGDRFARPKAVAVDGEGRLFVSDTQRGTVLAFAPDGTFLYGVGEIGDLPGQLSLPAGVAIGEGRLFVADGQHRRIESYRFLGDGP